MSSDMKDEKEETEKGEGQIERETERETDILRDKYTDK